MTASVRPLHANRDVSREFPRQGRDEHGGKPKFEAKGHDRQLEQAQFGGRQIEIETMSGALRVGVLIRRDRYTVTLRHPGGSEPVSYTHLTLPTILLV